MWRWRRGINCPFAGCYNQTLFSGLSAHHMAHSGWVCSQRTAWSSCPAATFPSLPLLSPPLVGSRRDNKKHWWNKRDIWGLDDANEGIWDDVTNVTCGGVNIFGNTHCKMPLRKYLFSKYNCCVCSIVRMENVSDPFYHSPLIKPKMLCY